MKTNLFFKYVLLFLFVVSFSLQSIIGYSQSSQYNVLFIVSDDMNDHCTFFGDTDVVMPNLQRLAAHGMLFRRAYCQYPLCSPTRTSLLSGWRPDKTGIFVNNTRPNTIIDSHVVYMPEYFKQNGYRTERYGKIFHGTFENDITWDYAEPPEALQGDGGGKKADGKWWVTTVKDSILEDGKEARHLVIRMKQPQLQPFFYALGFHNPHEPFTPSLTYWNKNGDASAQELLPVNSSGRTTNRKGNGSGSIPIPETPANDLNDIPAIALTDRFPKPDTTWQRIIHAYDAEIAQTDAQLGLILDELDSQNLWINTIVIFFGDHGQHLGEHQGLWGKLTLFEESLHAPLIICSPGKQAGECSRLVEFVDIYPTLTELCGLPPFLGMEGISFAPLLDNPNQPWKRAAFSQVTRVDTLNDTLMERSIRTEQYRYNSWGVDGEELYDHYADSNEYTNLASDSAYATTLNEMRTILAEGWKRSLPPCVQTFYKDVDGDGYGNAADTVWSCLLQSGYVANNTDCNDSNTSIHPGAIEICNGIDDNCDGQIDEIKSIFYHDVDADGFGNLSDTVQVCAAPTGYVSNSTDCNDSNINVHPGATEICNGIDDDCDDQIDEGTMPAQPGPISGPRYNLCGGGTFTYSIAPVANATSYIWTVPAGFTLVQNNGTSAQIQVPASFTSAQIKVAASNFCGTSAQSSLTVYAVAPNPSTGIVGPTTVTSGQQGVVYKLPNGPGVTYTWIVPTGATIVSGQGTFKITVNFGTTSGYVKVTVSNTCGTAPQGKVYVTVGGSSKVTNDVIAKSYLRAYPNPTQSIANVLFNADKTGSKYEIVVTDVYGKAILRKSGVTNIGDNMLQLDMSSMQMVCMW